MATEMRRRAKIEAKKDDGRRDREIDLLSGGDIESGEERATMY